ncbi:MAG TPA: hypothetical protein VHW91_06220 [Candidatus Dormibacteraeota bacterium]|nr:hypothetical protein [Candidatus Dormibacteraeota bacterium]
MAMPQPAISGRAVTVGHSRWARPWILWILASIVGGAAGAAVAWQMRAFVAFNGSPTQQDLVRYLATIASALIGSGAQWFVLKRYKLDAYWWVPATVAAGLINAMVVIPSVLQMFVRTSGATSLVIAIMAGAAALAASGLVVGTAQALVLRSAALTRPWLWVPATMLGGALSGAITTALSSHLLSLGAIAVITLSATGALLAAACQAPVLTRILRADG